MRIGDLIEMQSEAIVREWEDAMAKLPTGQKLPRPALADDVRLILSCLAEWLKDPTEPVECALHDATPYALQQLAHGVAMLETLTEYRMLRQAILRRMIAYGRDFNVVDLSLVDEALDCAASEAVKRFITARNEQIHLGNDRLRLAVETSQLGTWDLYPKTGQLTWDTRCRELSGLSADAEPSYESFLAQLHSEDRQRTHEAVKRALDPAGSGHYRNEYRVVASQGRRGYRWLLAEGQAFFDENGDAARFIGTVRDITDRKTLEDARGRFIGILGHDLRNPLTAISMAASRLLDANLDEHIRLVLASRIGRSARRMSQLIEDLIDYTRIQAGYHLPVRKVVANFDTICGNAIEELTANYPHRTIDYRAEGSPSGIWDPDRIAQVIMNLVGNALKYSPPETPVLVRWQSEDGNAVILSVHNQGRPIPAVLLPHIFEPFQVGLQTPETETRSLGLGLFIVREIIDAHGGRLKVTSTAEEGTTFTIYLPRQTPI